MMKDIRALPAALALSVALFVGVPWLAHVSVAQQGGGNVGAPGSGNAGYPPGATPVAASVTVANTTSGFLGIPAAAGKFSYLCGFEISGLGATAATTVSPTISTLSGTTTMTFVGAYTYVAGAAAFNVPLTVTFPQCLVGSTTNQSVAVTVPGAGGNTSTTWNVWGYQQ